MMKLGVNCLLAVAMLAGCHGKNDTTTPDAHSDESHPKVDESLCDPDGKTVVTADLNHDGKPDVWRLSKTVDEGGTKVEYLTCKQIDFDHDGRKDWIVAYNRKGMPLWEKADFDFDGKWDMFAVFDPETGKVVEIQRDSDFDGKYDVREIYDGNGQLVRVERDRNGDGKPDIWEQYKDGVLVAIDYDDNYDGKVDRRDDSPNSGTPPTPPQQLAQPNTNPPATPTTAPTTTGPDRDKDGIADNDDACPDRHGETSPSRLHNGCPRTIEQAVVLADEYGNVGAVEADDGKHKAMLDKAYSANEIGSDGQSRQLILDPSDVSSKYAAVFAAQPPGARIVVYFTENATPARDLTGPIDNLAAELRARTTPYTLEVIGHTDSTGTAAINDKIGHDRAQLIADKLVAGGIAKDKISVISKGSREPAVARPGAATVELRNRRVEIWVK